MKKLYNELMGSTPQKLTKHKFLDFAKLVLKGSKLIDTDLKELFNLYCKKNKKKENEPTTTKAALAKGVMKKWLRKSTISSKESPFSFNDTLNSKKSQEGKLGRSTSLFNKSMKKNSAKPKKKETQEEKKLSMEALSTAYDEYLKQEENLSGVLNTKTLNLKNTELKDKINYWRQRKDLRELTTHKINEKEQEIEEITAKYSREITVDKELLEQCIKNFSDLALDRHETIKQENCLNNFLLELKDFKLLEIRDLRK